MSSHKRKIFVISAPSGTGKTTIVNKLKEKIGKTIEVITTFTTRKPRPGEKSGYDYYFITTRKFKEMIKQGAFAEWAMVYGNYYGTPKKDINEAIKKGKDALLVIDTQGGMSIKKLFPDAVLIGILPPSIKEQERRIRKRDGLTEEEIKRRIEEAKKERKIIMSKYDYHLINKNLKNTIKKIERIIKREMNKNG
ncbi:MAG: guanylate kinase [Candidatus Ratteibacteria bacterium]|nr:guanylate kinase [Candidatus Ratteibacteria bacterium]